MDSSLLYFIFSLVAVTIVAIGVIYRFRVRRARGELTQLALLTSHVNQGTYPIHIYTQRQGVGNNNNISSASDGRRKGCLTMQELDAMFPSTRFCDLSQIHRAAILRSSDPNSSSSADKHDTDSIKSSKLQLQQQQQQQQQANPSSSITTDTKNRSSSPPPPFSSTVSEVESSTVFINESTTTDTEPPTKSIAITQKPVTEDTRIDRDSIDLEAQKNCLTVKESEIAQPQLVLDRHEQEGNSLICVICQDDIITTDVEPNAISSTSTTEKGTTKSNTRDDTSSDSSGSSNSSSSSSETDSDEESEKENLNEKLMVRVLLCNHCFHSSCITRWLVNTKAVCPLCFRNVLLDVPEAAHIENAPIRYTGSTTSSFSTSSSGSPSR